MVLLILHPKRIQIRNRRYGSVRSFKRSLCKHRCVDESLDLWIFGWRKRHANRHAPIQSKDWQKSSEIHGLYNTWLGHVMCITVRV